jgi:hypothetical protein
MTLRRMQISAIAAVLFTFALSFGMTPPTSGAAVRSAPTTTTPAVRRAANWTFEGCWTQFSAGPCRDVYRDQQGSFWICRACGTTGNPGPGKSNPISPATLSTGFWCS